MTAKELFEHNLHSVQSNDYYWGKKTGRHVPRVTLDPSHGDKHLPSENLHWVNKNKVRSSFEAAAFLGVGGYLTGEIMGGAAAVNEAAISASGGATSLLEAITSNDALMQAQSHIIEQIIK